MGNLVNVSKELPTFKANQGLDKACGYCIPSGNRILATGEANAIGMGILFIANPDLVTRFRNDLPMNTAKPEFFHDVPAGRLSRLSPCMIYGRLAKGHAS